DRAVSGVSVRSVRKNGIADRTGIRSGDSIEAIDDRPVNESTTFEDGSTLKTIRILRDGRQIVLPIKN
ncbi:MAG: PDZ domain-containing protein, partial [Blastocatellia bacterium]|nr:PDZ domain-containing protein [Blastocatellia bacterium]